MEKETSSTSNKRSLQSSSSCKLLVPSSSSVIPIDEQLRMMNPSNELQYYRKKMDDLTKDYEDLLEDVERCKSLIEINYNLDRELQQRNDEIKQLQDSLSDLQIYVYQEREQALRLYAENDRLKINAVEDRKKIHLLMSLAGVAQHELTYFLSASRPIIEMSPLEVQTRREEVKKKSKEIDELKHLKDKIGYRKNEQKKNLGDKFRQNNNSVKDEQRNNSKRSAEEIKSESDTYCCSIDPDIQLLHARSLSIQLEEQTKLFHDQVQCFLKDRELSRKEEDHQREKLQKHISTLSERLRKSDEILCEAVSKLAILKEKNQKNEIAWITERDQLLKNLRNVREQLVDSYPSERGYAISGGGTNTKLSSTILQSDFNLIKEKLSQRENMVCLYQNQCHKLEDELKRTKCQAETSRKLFKERTQKISGQVAYLRNKYNELDRRRMLEAEGFRNDIKMLRSRFQDVDRFVSKLKSVLRNTQTSVTSDKEIVSSAHLTISGASLLQQELKQIKKKVYEIESDLKSDSD